MTIIIRMPYVFGPRWSEWIGTMASIGAGMGLLHPYIAFESTSFALFTWAPEWVWGVVLLTLGLIRATGLIINGRRKRTTSWMRYWSAFFSFMIFFGLSIGLAGSGVMSTWPGAWPVFAINEFVNMLRAAQDARIGHESTNG